MKSQNFSYACLEKNSNQNIQCVPFGEKTFAFFFLLYLDLNKYLVMTNV